MNRMCVWMVAAVALVGLNASRVDAQGGTYKGLLTVQLGAPPPPPPATHTPAAICRVMPLFPSSCRQMRRRRSRKPRMLSLRSPQ